jgi:hypothetical protein
MTAPETTQATIPDAISDGAPTSVPEPVAKPDLVIQSTQVKQMEVVEPPELPELPPVRGTKNLTVHLVDDPGLPDPAPPASPSDDDPQVEALPAEMSANHPETRIVFVSATVYDHKRTLLTCHPAGVSSREITVWSNLDFNHFQGFPTFEATGADGEVRSYALLTCVGNGTAANLREQQTAGETTEEPAIPALPDDKPAFVIQTESPDPESVTLIEDLHALYRAEGTRMAEACAAREKAREERKAFLLANPPKPKDVTVHFWKREQQVAHPDAPAATEPTSQTPDPP